MATLVVSAAAHTDLRTIQLYLRQEAGAEIAQSYAARFADTFVRLKQSPASGAPRPHLGTGTRVAVVVPYVVFYDYDPAVDEAVIVRVLHGRRHITEKLLDG